MKPTLISLLLFLFAGIGCKKYEDFKPIQAPAYLRVFNDITEPQTPFHAGAALPFFTFIYDPTFDSEGGINGGAIVGDYLDARQTFSLSYPLNAGNSGNATGSALTTNFDYPGKERVPAAPSINGLDLSAWAQIPSGRHRVVFIQRPLNKTGFTDLPLLTRKTIFLDSTIDFTQGEVYTMHVVTRDLDNSRYGIYLRQENFTHQHFNSDSIYVRFFNLTGKRPAASNFNSDYAFFVNDSLRIFYSYSHYDSKLNTGVVFPFYNNLYYTSLYGTFQHDVPYLNLPLLTRSNFFDFQGNLLSYTSSTNTKNTFPTFTFDLQLNKQNPAAISDKVEILCNADPSTVNFNNNNGSPSIGYTLGATIPNLNIITSVDGKIGIYPSINTIEVVNDRVYLMQIQRLF